MSDPITLAVDVGGTFTDAVVSAPHGLFTGKSPTTPEDQSIGVLQAATVALTAAGVEPADVGSFLHGMTVTTNAMLESNFSRTALMATRGFTDIEELGRQDRPELYKLCVGRAEPIVPRELRFAIDERCGPDGVIDALDEASVLAACEKCAEANVEAIAVCLLFSFRHPDHERRIGELIAAELPDVHVSLSHDAVGTFREYERCATTIADAALSPLLGNYLDRLSERSIAAGLPAPQVMLSNGGTVSAALASRNASWTVLSGPAGGAVGAAIAAERAGAAQAIGFDMGGTSTDVCTIENGRVLLAERHEIGGRPIALPTIDIGTVGAGGGSIAWRDDGGALRVGPQSAGAVPGPACYGRGGEQPTVTDANLLLGYLDDRSSLASGLQLDRDAATSAVGRLARTLDLEPTEAAAGIVQIANLEMQGEVSAMTVARGIDPRGHALVAFGGAGPMHAAAIAESLEIDRVICPAACGVLSAFGMAAAGPRRDRSLSIVRPLAEIEVDELTGLIAELTDRAGSDLGLTPPFATHVEHRLRYSGQAFELAVEHDRPVSDLKVIGDAFHALHETRFGFSDRSAAVELVTVHVSVASGIEADIGPAAQATLAASKGPAGESQRKAWFHGEWHESRVFHGPLGDSDNPTAVAGPAIVELDQATIIVPPGWSIEAVNSDHLMRRAAHAGGIND